MKELFHYKILLVYDNRENFFSISSKLNVAGYYCDIAFSEKEALQFLLKNEYGLIVFDITTTMKKGFELAASIKRSSKTKGIPMVFLCEKAIPKEFFFKGYETDMIGYLIKPFNEDTLLFKVRNFLQFHHSSVQLEKANIALEKKAVQAKISFQDLYYSLPQTVFLINRIGIIVNVNRHGMLSCGLFARDILQKHYKKTRFLLEILGASENTPGFRNIFELKDDKKTTEFILEKPDKTVFYGEAVISLAIIDGEPHIQVSVIDITEKKKADELLKLNFLEISNSEKINNAILHGASINEISDLLLDALASIASINASRIYLYDKENNKLNLVGELMEKNVISGMEQKFGIKLQTFEPPLLEGTLFKKIVDQKQGLITSNKSEIKQLLSEHTDNYIIKQMAGWARDFMNAMTCGVLPLIVEGNVLGLITFSSPKVLQEEEKQATLRFSQQAATVLAIKKNELALAKSEERFELAMEGANDGLWDWNLLTNGVYFSKRWKNMLGYSVNELEDNVSTWENLLHADDKERSFGILQQYLYGRQAEYKVEFRMKHKNGTYVDILARGQGLRDDKGQLYRMIGTHTDITDRKKAEREILRQKKFTESIFNNLPTEIAVLDTSQKYTFVNSKSINDPGIRESLIGKNDYDFCKIKGIDNSVAIERSKLFEEMMASKAEVEWVDQHLTKAGKTKYVLRKYFPVVENNTVQFVIGYGVDITERKREEEKLLKSEYMLAEAQRIGKIGSWDFDIETNTVSWSKEMYEIYRCNPATFIPSVESLISLLPAEHKQPMGNWISASMSGVKQSYLDFHLDFPDGSKKFIRGYGEVFFSKTGKPIRAIGIGQDITLMKKAEAQLLKTVNELSDRYNELMQFNYIVSHNLRGPIANILGLANILNMPDTSEEEKPKIFEFIKSAAIKMDTLVKDLGSILSNRSPLNAKKETVSIAGLIQGISSTLENQIFDANAVIKTEIAEEAKEVFSIRSYMESIFYNLISNAIKYKSKQRPLQISISTKKADGNIVISVSDNGRGIDMTRHGENIFGLYKRFHLDIEGKGLGLHMTKTQVEALGGRITVDSIHNEGTTFKITIPV